jgi:hypothetical protein
MSDRTFQEAYDRVRRRYSDREWLTLGNHRITEEIYREMREIDAERRRNTSGGDPKPDQGQS